MNTKEITKNIRAESIKLQHGDDTEKHFAQELAATAQKIDDYRKTNERPIKAETLKDIRVGKSKFTPRHLP